MSFAIVTDSLAGLPLAQIARRGLVVIPPVLYHKRQRTPLPGARGL